MGLNFTKESQSQCAAWHETRPNEILGRDIVHETVKGIMEDYDLLMLVERFDESLVVLQLLLGLTTQDILYFSSKKAGSYYHIQGSVNVCSYLEKPALSEIVTEHLASDEWYAKQYGDYLLMEAVNQSLDLTIDALGRGRFNQALQRFKTMNKQANEKCLGSVFFPCSENGTLQLELSQQSCYKDDLGCGYKCLDELFIDKLNG